MSLAGAGEWRTRWAELEPMLRESPVETLPDAADLVSEMLEQTHRAPEGPPEPTEELTVRYQEARTVAERVAAGDEVDVFEIGQAAEALRQLHSVILQERTGPAA